MHERQKNIDIKQRRQIVAGMYLEGKTQHEIAIEVNVSQGTISNDLKAIQKLWIEKSIEAIDKKKAEELAKIDKLERTYWESWERSLEAFKSKTVKGKKAEAGKDANIEQTLKEEERVGDPRFLTGVQWCIEKRLKLFGLEAPQKWAPTDPTGEKPYKLMDENELANRFMAIVNGSAANQADTDPND
jgi:hypothetical protein